MIGRGENWSKNRRTDWFEFLFEFGRADKKKKPGKRRKRESNFGFWHEQTLGRFRK